MTPVTPSSVCDPFDSRDFYELCQAYRWSKDYPRPAEVVEAFEALKTFARAALAERTQQEALTDAQAHTALGARGYREAYDAGYRAATSAANSTAPMQPSDEVPSAGAIEEWRTKAADYDRLAGIARNRRMVLEEIAGLKNLTATDKQFWQALQRLAKKAVDDYTFQGDYEDRPEQQAGVEVSDDLAYALLGYRPEQMSERDAAIIRERARRRWADLCEVAQVPNYKAMYEELAHGIAAEHNEEMRRIGRVE